VTTKYVYDFEEGNKDMKYVIGGKGANLAEMTNMGLPVPPGFTISTEACNAYRKAGRSFPDGLLDEVAAHLATLEAKMGRTLGDPDDPQLVSARSGAAFSMPGMMDTVLNVGLNDASVEGLAKQTGSERFAWDSYRRLLQMFGKTVLGVDGDHFEEAIEHTKEAKGVTNDVDLSPEDLRGLVATFKDIIREHAGREFPQDPREQMHLCIEAVFGSWDNKRAVDYRRKNRIDDDLGTAVNIQAMVFGNKGEGSGTGVAFTRNPANGENHPYGDYLENAQGEDVVAGIRNTLELDQMGDVQPQAWAELQQHLKTLEQHYTDMCDVEFTVEQGKLWLLQTRVGKRTAYAEWVMAYDMVNEGLIDADTGMTRLTAGRLEELFKKVIASDAATEPVASGLNASPGAAVGKAVFSADEAEQWAQRGEPVILVRRETTPDDYHGMISSQGILTSAGGTNSHAAVVARGEGIPAVCGADGIRVDRAGRKFTANGTTVAEGEWVTIDGFTGKVYAGQLELADSPVEQARAGDPEARKAKIWQAYELFMRRADEVRRLKVRANADTPQQSANAVERGAEGIGLCRTEHMFLGEERVAAVRRMIFADTREAEQAAYDTLLPLQRQDFVGIFEAMGDRPVTVRLLDPPLHEFLPDQVELAVAVALARQSGEGEIELGGEKLPIDDAETMLGKVNDLHEANPMLGLRGVRLGIVKPGLYEMQTRAIIEAAVQVKRAGGDPHVEIMIPLAATREELAQMREDLEPIVAEVLGETGTELDLVFGTMIELPRAALVAGEIAEVADFFSFGTNDLSQTAFGFSRDDIGKFLGMYEERKLVPANPFVTIDKAGVGRLMRIASEEGRATREDLKLGICGEHGGDPDSVVFCHELGLDYVSCSPFRVPVARLAAGQAVLGESRSSSK
jgi:pyruvate,orthophosphate dikinase